MARSFVNIRDVHIPRFPQVSETSPYTGDVLRADGVHQLGANLRAGVGLEGTYPRMSIFGILPSVLIPQSLAMYPDSPI